MDLNGDMELDNYEIVIGNVYEGANLSNNPEQVTEQMALEAYTYRVAKYIGSYVAAMNGVDVIAFTAGIGENDGRVRGMVGEYLDYLGCGIDPEKLNQLQSMNAILANGGIGLRYAVSMLRQFYGEDAQLQIENLPLHGTRVTVRLDMWKEREDDSGAAD